ncbi:amidohydrolase family protein [Ralstonia syzygii]|uniref:hypothetical protein n=1 Tax=Ralstonia syzygii TaxID=28097 RepID=UPI0036F2B636
MAHGTYDLVKRADATTSKPLVLSHTALSGRPGLRSRLITADRARAVANTGGVIGVWPNAADYPSLDAMAEGIKRLADAVGRSWAATTGACLKRRSAEPVARHRECDRGRGHKSRR